MWRTLVLLLFAVPLFAQPSAYDIALLVHETEARPSAALEDALASPQALVRATAARVIAIRGIADFVPRLREAVVAESDPVAAREMLRTVALLGMEEDIAFGLKTAARWPDAMDDAIAASVARRGDSALQSYLSRLRESRMGNRSEFFQIALWGRGEAIAVTGARLLGAADEPGWRGLLRALEDSNLAMNAGVLVASLGSRSEDIRAASLWYLVRGYAPDPQSLTEPVKQEVTKTSDELSSDRVDFGLELLRRMLGQERKDEPRWLRFLASEEADRLVGSNQDVLQYLSDAEYQVRYDRCGIQATECEIPPKRRGRTIPSQTVAQPAFNLPGVLPPGLADAIVSGARCRDSWIGVATATLDAAGRVTAVDFGRMALASSCRRALETILRLSFAEITSMRSDRTGPVLLVHSSRAPLCLDEDLPLAGSGPAFRVGGEVQAPKVKKRVEPQFPASARRSMGGASNVLIVAEAVISKTGCVRSVRLLTQSPYPELNGAAVLALSQWLFTPAYLDKTPVDVIFHLALNFTVP